jgi:hypothetical protein
MTATGFMRAISHGMPDRYHLALWAKGGSNEWFSDADEAADHATAIDAEGTDVYSSLAFWRDDYHSRTAADVAGIFGLRLDVDVNGTPDGKGGVKTGAAPSIADAEDLAGAIATPSFVVFTGGGVQPVWLFDEPWLFASDEERDDAAVLARRWQAAHADLVPWSIDSTANLDRVGRIPGTHNYKGDTPRLVTVGSAS